MIKKIIFLTIIYNLVINQNAQAYIDPASLGFAFQAITIFFATIVLYIRKPSEILKDIKKLIKWIEKKFQKKKL